MTKSCTRMTAILVALAAVSSTGAFAPSVVTPQSTTSLQASRRAFLDAAVASAATFVASSSPVFAEESFGDLSMPSEEEQKKAAEDAMAERLRRKAELQKAASKPMNFKDSVETELKKKESLKKSKEERRNALCEELGRGC